MLRELILNFCVRNFPTQKWHNRCLLTGIVAQRSHSENRYRSSNIKRMQFAKLANYLVDILITQIVLRKVVVQAASSFSQRLNPSLYQKR